LATTHTKAANGGRGEMVIAP